MAGIRGNAKPRNFLLRFFHAVKFKMKLKTFMKSLEAETSFHVNGGIIEAVVSYFD